MCPGLGRLPFDWEQPEKEPAHYFQVELSPTQMKFLRDVSYREVTRQRAKAAKAMWASVGHELELARRMEGERAKLPWGELEAEAKRQGVDVVDVLFDRAHAHE